MSEHEKELHAEVKKLRDEIKTYRRQLKALGNPSSASVSLPSTPPEGLAQLATHFGSDLLFQLDEKTKISLISASARTFLGMSPADATGRDFDEILRESDRRRWEGYLAASERSTALTVTFATGRSAPVPAEVRVQPVTSERGRTVGWVGLARRLGTENVRSPELIQDEARLASGLAHELNQPVTAMGATARACARLLRSGQSEPDELLTAVDQIARQADRAGEIIKRLRDLMMQGKRHRARIDLNELVRESIALLTDDLKAAQVKARFELAPDLPTIVADPIQIGQVIVNLARNGLEAMLQAPRVHRTLLVQTAADVGEVTVTVTDRGTGLSVSVIDRLFEPFASSKPQGMGMGLALSRHIIQAHGGRLWAKPNPDRGMSFTFSLPLTDEKSEP